MSRTAGQISIPVVGIPVAGIPVVGIPADGRMIVPVILSDRRERRIFMEELE